MNRICWRVWILTVTACAAGVWARDARGQDRLVLLTPHWEGIRNEFFEGFRERYRRDTGRDAQVEYLDVGGGTSDQLRYIRSQFKATPDGIGVDLMFGGGVDPYWELKKDGLLQAYRVPDDILSKTAPDIGGLPLYDSDGMWYSVTMAGFGIVYNKPLLKRLGLAEPKTWEDLARPEAFSWVGSGDPRKSGVSHMVYEIILQAYGWERGWRVITAMGANVRAFASGSMQPTTDVSFGELAYAQSIDFYAQMQMTTHGEDRIGFVWPAGLTAVNGDAIGILKGAPNVEVARRFLDFCLSEDGQQLLMLKRGEPGGPRKYELGKFSVMPALYDKLKGRTLVGVNPFEWKTSFQYDAKRGSARYGIVNDLIGAMVIDSSEQLTAAWRRAIERKTTAAELPTLSAMPVTEDEALELVTSGKWGDAAFRSQTLGEWTAFARQKYGARASTADYLRNLPMLVALVVGGVMFVYARRRRS